MDADQYRMMMELLTKMSESLDFILIYIIIIGAICAIIDIVRLLESK